jgi:hypothetical protein
MSRNGKCRFPSDDRASSRHGRPAVSRELSLYPNQTVASSELTLKPDLRGERDGNNTSTRHGTVTDESLARLFLYSMNN